MSSDGVRPFAFIGDGRAGWQCVWWRGQSNSSVTDTSLPHTAAWWREARLIRWAASRLSLDYLSDSQNTDLSFENTGALPKDRDLCIVYIYITAFNFLLNSRSENCNIKLPSPRWGLGTGSNSSCCYGEASISQLIVRSDKFKRHSTSNSIPERHSPEHSIRFRFENFQNNVQHLTWRLLMTSHGGQVKVEMFDCPALTRLYMYMYTYSLVIGI